MLLIQTVSNREEPQGQNDVATTAPNTDSTRNEDARQKPSLLGSWETESFFDIHGNRAALDKGPDFGTVEISETDVELTFNGERTKLSYEIDASKTPNRIILRGPDVQLRGIIELRNDQLMVAINGPNVAGQPAKEYPENFVSSMIFDPDKESPSMPDNPTGAFVLQRMK